MNSEEFRDMLKEHLTIRLSEKHDYGGKGIKVEIYFDDQKICGDYVFTQTWQD